MNYRANGMQDYFCETNYKYQLLPGIKMENEKFNTHMYTLSL